MTQSIKPFTAFTLFCSWLNKIRFVTITIQIVQSFWIYYTIISSVEWCESFNHYSRMLRYLAKCVFNRLWFPWVYITASSSTRYNLLIYPFVNQYFMLDVWQKIPRMFTSTCLLATWIVWESNCSDQIYWRVLSYVWLDRVIVCWTPYISVE